MHQWRSRDRRTGFSRDVSWNLRLLSDNEAAASGGCICQSIGATEPAIPYPIIEASVKRQRCLATSERKFRSLGYDGCELLFCRVMGALRLKSARLYLNFV